MIFAGPLSNPATLVIPGVVPPGTPILNKCFWGEDIKVSIPDPGFNCSIHLVIKSRPEQVTADLTKTVERESSNGNIEITISRAESIEKLFPGVFFFQAMYVATGGNSPGETRLGPQGMMELNEVAAGTYDPAEE
jgi:hypothetical protein